MARPQAFLDIRFFFFPSTSSNFYENDLNFVYCGEYPSRMTPRFITQSFYLDYAYGYHSIDEMVVKMN